MMMAKKARTRKTQRGFTLVELLVVIVILGVLSAIVAVNVLPAGDTARMQAASTQITAFRSALQQYELEVGRIPTQSEGLEALVTVPTNSRDARNFRVGGYLGKTTLPDDPWGNAYQYQTPGEFGRYDIYSFGRDGKPGGTGVDADIFN